jgi:hypothetical protein
MALISSGRSLGAEGRLCPGSLPLLYQLRIFDQNHFCFANFSNAPVSLDGKDWMTSEHLFQAWKVRHSSFLIGMISKHLFNSSRTTQSF